MISVVEHPKEGLKAHVKSPDSFENIDKILGSYTIGWELVKG